MGKTQAFSGELLGLVFTGLSIAGLADNASSSPATSLYLSLHVMDPGEDGDQTTGEASYGGYARVTVDRSDSAWTVSAGVCTNDAVISWPKATSGSEVEMYFAVGTASSGTGKILYSGVIPGAGLSVSAGVTPRLVAGACSFTDVVGVKGWTVFTESPGTVKIYVSTSGSDSNDGLSESFPKLTIAAGVALLRDGEPDWLLLKKGDVWTDEVLSGFWTKSGSALSEPMLVTSYGTGARPLLRTGGDQAIYAYADEDDPPIRDIAFVDLHFEAHDRQGQNNGGIEWLAPAQNLLIEGCLIEGYETNIIFPASHANTQGVKLRRNVLVDAYRIGSGTSGHGLFMASCPQALIEENLFDHNGWTDSIPGTIFRHSMYITGFSVDVTLRGNIISNGSSHGCQMRKGGDVEDNLFVRCSIAFLGGGGNTPTPGGVQINFRRNVILDGKNIVDGSEDRGWAIDLANIMQGEVSDNIIANQTIGNFQVVMNLYGDSAGDGVHNLTIRDNVAHDWGGTVGLQGDSTEITNLSIEGNDFQEHTHSGRLLEHYDGSSTASIGSSADNNFYSDQTAQPGWIIVGGVNTTVASWASQVSDTTSQAAEISYSDPGRTVASYHGTLGETATHDAFIVEARLQSKDNWRTEYTASAVNDYIRAGFQ